MLMPKVRLTINGFIAYQPYDSAPEDLSPPAYERSLYSDEQIWKRHLTVGEEWVPVPLGWLEDAPLSLLIIHNTEGRFTQLQPAPEEKKAVMDRVVEIGMGANGQPYPIPFTIVRPLQFQDFEPVGRVYVRCRSGQARVNITAVPA